MTLVKAAWPIVFLGVAAASPAAEQGEQPDGLAWLKKMASASRQFNYTGTFIYRYGNNQTETSRVAHYVNAAGGEFEKLETLDGAPREVIRTNDQVTCYLPGTKTITIEKRSAQRFPAMLPEKLGAVTDNYNVRKDGMDRVAGNEDCRHRKTHGAAFPRGAAGAGFRNFR